ncbi:MAG: hypothetical protein Q9186_000504 [Xanthomendoza sp. 1 TL-2023]
MSFSVLRRQFARASSTPSRSAFINPSTQNSIQAGTSVFTARYASSSSSSSSATGGDLGNPQSTSSDQKDVKASRATDGNSSPDTASVQTPVSNRSKIPGDQDEGTESHDKVKRDPSEPAEVKRKSVESQANKPLGPEDHQ